MRSCKPLLPDSTFDRISVTRNLQTQYDSRAGEISSKQYLLILVKCGQIFEV